MSHKLYRFLCLVNRKILIQMNVIFNFIRKKGIYFLSVADQTGKIVKSPFIDMHQISTITKSVKI
jgi:hypothetical protein